MRGIQRVGALCWLIIVLLAGTGACQSVASSGQTTASGPPTVYVKTTFETNAPAFEASGNAAVTLTSGSEEAIEGRALRITRKASGGYIGAALEGLRIEGSSGLRVAFSTRAIGVRTVTVNLFDAVRSDNTTPASPARIGDTEWRTVVLHVEDFHYNSDQPDQKVAGGERFVGLLFHGSPESDTPQIWIDNVVVYRGPDRTAPAPPSGLQAQVAGNVVDLHWTAPPDDTFAATYSIHRQSAGGQWIKVGESLRPIFRDAPAAAGRYRYRVTAADYENNVSSPSANVEVEAIGGTKPDPGTTVVQDRLGYAGRVREVHARGLGSVVPGVVLFAGDSLTAAALYTHILGSWLAHGRPVRQGVGTVRTDYAAEHIGEYLRDARPEFAVVMYGTNDQKGDGDVRAAMRNLSAVVDACFAAGTVPILATIPPQGYSKDQRDQEGFNRALVAMARERQVPVSYVFEEMMRHDLRAILSDGLHLAPEAGNDAAGRALRQTMDQVYFALRDN